MSRDTPEAVFEEARAAVARADWTTFFSCLDDADVLSLTKNSGLLGLSKAQELAAQFGISLEDLFPKREALAKAAEAVLDGADSDRLSRSLSVRDLAKQLEAELELKLRAVRDPPGFAGAIETAKRAEMGGGTVSSRMFQDEELRHVVVDGNKARGDRVMASGSTQAVGFVKKSGSWRIKLRAR